MAASALADVFEQVMLLHKVPTLLLDGFDDYGNPIYQTVDAEYIARVKVSNNNALIQQYGVDAKQTLFEGAFVRPAIIADGVQVGSRFAMTWRSLPGAMTLKQIKPRALLVVDEALGQRFYATWQPFAAGDIQEVYDHVFAGATYG